MGKKLIFFSITLILSSLLSVSYAKDILSDFQKDDTKSIKGDLPLSSDSIKKAEALAHFAQAFILSKEKDPEKSFDNLITAIGDDPEAEIPLSFLVLELNNNKKLKKNIDRLSEIAEKNPQALSLNIVVASILINYEKFDAAVVILENSLKSAKADTPKKENDKLNLISILTELYSKQGAFEKADDILQDTLDDQKYKDNIRIRISALLFYSIASEKSSADNGWLWFDSSREEYRKKAEEILKSCEEIYSKKALLLEDLSFFVEFYKKNKAPQKAVNLLLNTLLTRPNDTKVKAMLASFWGDTGEYSKAFRLWEVLSLSKNFQPYLYWELGRAALRGGYFKQASKAFEWYLVHSPENDLALYQLGLAYYEMEMHKKALSKLNKVKILPEASHMASLIYAAEKNFKDALQELQKAEEISIREKRKNFLTKDFYMYFAFVADKAGNPELSEKYIRKVLDKNKNDAEALNFLGYIWAEQNKNLDEAEKLIAEALNADNNNVAYLDSMAWVLYKKGNYQEALKYIQNAIVDDTNIPEALIADHAGDIFLAAGDIPKAIKYWELALSVYSEETVPGKIKQKINKYKK